MSKASDIGGFAPESGDYGDERTYSMWEVFGNPLMIKKSLYEKEGNFQGKETLSVLSEVEWSNPETNEFETIKLWVNGQLANKVSDFFKTHIPGTVSEDTIEGTIWLSPTVGIIQYNGWCILDSDITPDDYTMPEKAAKRLAEEHKKGKAPTAKEMSFVPGK